MDILNCQRKRKRPSYLDDYESSGDKLPVAKKKVRFCKCTLIIYHKEYHHRLYTPKLMKKKRATVLYVGMLLEFQNGI